MKGLWKGLSSFEQILALIAVLLFLLAGYQAYQYTTAISDAERLEESITKARRSLSLLLDNDPVILKAELSKVEKELEEGKGLFPKTVAPLDVASLILGAAKTPGVNLSGLTAEARESAKKETLTASISFVVKGKTSSLFSLHTFFAEMEKGPFTTLKLDKVNLTEDGEGWNATFRVAVVTQAE